MHLKREILPIRPGEPGIPGYHILSDDQPFEVLRHPPLRRPSSSCHWSWGLVEQGLGLLCHQGIPVGALHG